MQRALLRAIQDSGFCLGVFTEVMQRSPEWERIEGEGPITARVFARAIQDSGLGLGVSTEVMQRSPERERMKARILVQRASFVLL